MGLRRQHYLATVLCTDNLLLRVLASVSYLVVVTAVVLIGRLLDFVDNDDTLIAVLLHLALRRCSTLLTTILFAGDTSATATTLQLLRGGLR